MEQRTEADCSLPTAVATKCRARQMMRDQPEPKGKIRQAPAISSDSAFGLITKPKSRLSTRPLPEIMDIIYIAN
jgi:hypothetical protein